MKRLELSDVWEQLSDEARFAAFVNTPLECLISQVAEARTPDFIIGDPSDPYLLRWWVVPRNGTSNLYLHRFLRSDDDRALHDHPWWNISRLLQGTYREIVPSMFLAHAVPGGRDGDEVEGRSHVPGMPGLRAIRRRVGDIVRRQATDAHRVELTDGPVWSLFMTGPLERQWGFYCSRGWVHFREFAEVTAHTSKLGRGCEG